MEYVELKLDTPLEKRRRVHQLEREHEVLTYKSMIGGDMIVVAARPAVGKSALVTQISMKLAKQSKRVAYYNLEMSDKQVYERLVSRTGGIDLTRLRRARNFLGDEKEKFSKANEELRESPVFLRSGSVSVGEIRNECKHMDFDCIIIDYIQLLRTDVRYQSRASEVGAISKAIKALVDYFFPEPYTAWINHTLIDSRENPGLPLGNQAGQVYALLMVHPVDCMITGELGITEYGRYADDFYLIHQDKEYLKWCLECIRELLKSLGLEMNGKTQIVPFRKGIRFLGFHHYMTADGKYIRKLTGENKRKNKKKFRRLVKDVKAGKLTEEKFYEKYNSWRNHASHGNCIKLIHSMDLYIERLMKGDSDEI